MHAGTALSDESRPTTNPGSPDGEGPPILVVDDSRVSQRLAGRLIEKGAGRRVVYANDGNQALALLTEVNPAIVLTDLQMPGMNGIELVEAIRANHPRVPVVLMTAYGSEDAAMLALKAGAAHYVPKKCLVAELVDTIRRILAIVTGDLRRQQILCNQTGCTRSFEIGNEVDLLAPLIELIGEDFVAFAIGDETARIRVAVALQESLANAVYHGNLECSSDLRQEDERIFYEQAARRQGSDPYRSRRVRVESRVGRDEIRIVISDEGPGFDVSSLDKPFNPEDLMRVGGRGMILIRTFLDEAFHNEKGNRITLVKKKQL